MSEPLTCLCGHDEDQHHEIMGHCQARACKCPCFRLEDDGFKDDDDEIPELDFDHDDAA